MRATSRHKDESMGSVSATRAADIAEADLEASKLFDQAITDAGLSNKEVAYLLGKSTSLVHRMRSTEERERVSFSQLLLLPPSFHIALHRRLNHRYGYSRAALARLIEAVSELAL